LLLFSARTAVAQSPEIAAVDGDIVDPRTSTARRAKAEERSAKEITTEAIMEENTDPSKMAIVGGMIFHRCPS